MAKGRILQLIFLRKLVGLYLCATGSCSCISQELGFLRMPLQWFKFLCAGSELTTLSPQSQYSSALHVLESHAHIHGLE